MATREITNATQRALRTRGYNDGVSGRTATSRAPVYLAAYRRGEARRKLLQEGGMETEK